MELRNFAFLILLILSACTSKNHDSADELNDLAYAYHYRSLDSTRVYAERAYEASSDYADGRAEAMNHLAFVSIAKMDYDRAKRQLDSVSTDNLIERLVADVQWMRLCQRESENKLFYDYRERAKRHLKRIGEERSRLSEHQLRRFVYAESELAIVESTYFYYVGLTEQSQAAMNSLDLRHETPSDTAQLLNYLYNIGSGGIVEAATKEEVSDREFEHLVRCYQLAHGGGYTFFEAQALQAMSEHLKDADFRARMKVENAPALALINPDEMADTLLAGYLAQRALQLFTDYGDVYQIAGAYRTLAECFWDIGDYQSAEICLLNALERDTVINRAPDLVASIREQFSLLYSAIDDKTRSDINRNIYLDMQERTRQDRQLEARADQLRQSSRQLNTMIAAVLVMILLVLVMLFLFHRLRRKNDQLFTTESLLEPLEKWEQTALENHRELEEHEEEIREQIALTRQHILNNKKRNLEQRAKVSLVNIITPFIDRILNEVRRLMTTREDAQVRQERCAYVAELTDKINEYNGVLTDWIQMRQGELNLRIESFPLQTLFEMVKRGRMAFQIKGIDFAVEDTAEIVKADKTLTLFMINTMADNARKFTQEGGRVKISSTAADDYVEISVSDTGCGMSEEQLSTLFTTHQPTQSNGFGLRNCKGIIEKYRKISKIFSVCEIAAESEQGRGSRFWFRLPKGVLRMMALIVFSASSLFGNAQNLPKSSEISTEINEFSTKSSEKSTKMEIQAAAFADSAYYCNIRGDFNRTLAFADSCRHYLNMQRLQLGFDGFPPLDRFMKDYEETTTLPTELQWYKDSIPMNYEVVLDIRNEAAVAALALHRWELYTYNNKVYTQLFRELSADKTLDNYCRVMQKSETDKNVAIILLIVLLLTIFPAYYFLYYRHRLAYRYNVERVNRINQTLLSNASPEEKLKNIQQLWADKTTMTDEKYGSLDELVGQISDSLQQSMEADKVLQDDIELAEDALNCLQYENDRLHISNNVLDNCLSTLKHETMYYPSRIRHLLPSENSSESTLKNSSESDSESTSQSPKDFTAIAELASYYKELYTMLSAQAMRQVEGTQRIDRDLLDYLFEILKKHGGTEPVASDVDAPHDYVKIFVEMPSLQLTDQQRTQLFTPLTIDFDYFLCRQIVRDFGEAANARACGIQAVRENNSEKIVITLTKQIWNLLK